jgi:hypothetical protein
MYLEHVRALVEPRLKLRIALRLRGRKPQILEGWRLGIRRRLVLRIPLDIFLALGGCGLIFGGLITVIGLGKR